MKTRQIFRNRRYYRWVGVMAIAALLACECSADPYSPAPSAVTPNASGRAPSARVQSFRTGAYAPAPVYRPIGQSAAPYEGQIIFQNPEDAKLFSGQPVGDIPSTATTTITAPMNGRVINTAPINAAPINGTIPSVGVPTNNSPTPASPVNSAAAPCPPGYINVGTGMSGASAANGSGLPVPFGGQNAASGRTDQYPNDEYISDGGIGPKGGRVRQDWRVDGLNPTNTIVHYDTLDGQVKVEASNKIEIYAPKFRSVRQVIDAVYNDQIDRIVSVDATQKLASQDRNVGGMTSKQHVPVAENASLTPGEQFVGRIGGAEVSNRRALMAFDNNYKAYEDLQIIRTGEAVRSEMAMTAEMERRASVWEYTQNTQVVVGEQRVMANVKDEGPGVLYTLDKDTDNPQVRIVKIASADSAQPGDRVEFTIRFDNTGDEAVGNVTIIDSLSGRLEYAEGTAQCSKSGNFSVEENEAESLILRWEITDPLEPGDGGIIRFECTVR